ncbi:DNA methyltransferase [Cypionkella sp. TWP1-2-1b2]|uniref:DNA methyltransferase n=1 Tax=Cypionkella sp. TWP1-2-1b2 TaxID=2804675 RepID=UPI003CFBBC5F
MSLHPGTDRYNPAGNSDFTRKAEALALGIRNWSTPKATDGAKGGPGQSYGSGGIPPLPAQAAQWQMPVADDQVDRLRGKINSRGEPKLSAQALQWPTPAAQNWKGSSPASVTRAYGKSRMDILHYRAEQGFTHPAPAITLLGLQPSHHAPISRPLWASMIASHGRVVSRRVLKARARRRLNPLFVGWLMGWPIGHALCACSATEFTHWQQQMRGALSRLPMASGPWIWRPAVGPEGPTQMNLFEGMLP